MGILNQARRRKTPSDPCALTQAEAAFIEAFEAHGSIVATGSALGISKKAADTRAQNIRDKLGAKTTAEAAEIWKKGRAA